METGKITVKSMSMLTNEHVQRNKNNHLMVLIAQPV